MLQRFFEVFLPRSSKFRGWRHSHRTTQSPKACCDKKVSKASGLTQQSEVSQRSCIQKRSALQGGSEAKGSKKKGRYCMHPKVAPATISQISDNFIKWKMPTLPHSASLNTNALSAICSLVLLIYISEQWNFNKSVTHWFEVWPR